MYSVHPTLMLRQEERVHNFGTYFDRGFFVAGRLFYTLQSTSAIWEQSGCSNITNHTLAPLIMSDLFPIFEHLDRLTALYGLYRQF